MPTWAKVIVGVFAAFALYLALAVISSVLITNEDAYAAGVATRRSTPYWLPPLLVALVVVLWGKGRSRAAIGLLVGLLVWLVIRLAELAPAIGAILGLALPVIGLVSAFLLAKPDSHWARRFYGPKKLQRSRERYGREPAPSSPATTG